MNQTIFKADVLERYVSLIMSSFFPEAKAHRNGNYNFRCNVCGDSKKKKNKKRGWILKNRTPWMFYCHNCQESLPVEIWMKIYFNNYYQDYMKEVFKIDIGIKKVESPPIKKVEFTGSEYNEYKDVQYFKPIFSSNDEIFQIARKECNRRLIPFDIWKKWFVAIDGAFINRLVIPYYDNNGKIYSYQCRSLKGQEPKYLSRINCEDNIYNYYNVDATRPIIILEGAIDSLFIENSIGCTGLKVHDERIKIFPQRYFLLDNDEPGREMSVELLKMKEWVFLWKLFLRDNHITPSQPAHRDSNYKPEKDDINELIMQLNRRTIIKFEEIQKYFTNDIRDRIYLV